MISYHESRQTLEEAELDHIWGVGGEEEEPPKFIGTRSFIPRVWTQFSSNNSCIKKRAWIFSKSYPPVWISMSCSSLRRRRRRRRRQRGLPPPPPPPPPLVYITSASFLCPSSSSVVETCTRAHAHVHMHTFISCTCTCKCMGLQTYSQAYTPTKVRRVDGGRVGGGD
jgi:hypothetical protein